MLSREGEGNDLREVRAHSFATNFLAPEESRRKAVASLGKGSARRIVSYRLLRTRFFGPLTRVREPNPGTGERTLKSEQIKEITDRATEQLVAALKAGHSETLTAYLKTIGRFHRYSLHNVLLIASQRPNASYVAGLRTWNELGRFIRKGEKGIMILAPIVRREPEQKQDAEERPSSITGFCAAYVFDVSQTEGRELPQIGIVAGDPGTHKERLRAFAAAQFISVEYSADIAPARGMSSGGKITLLSGLPPAEEFSTLAHELAHELLHRSDRRHNTSRRVRETEAEATAFVVCHAIGLEVGAAAADYIQLWSGDAQLLMESLGYVRQAASQMLGALEDS